MKPRTRLTPVKTLAAAITVLALSGGVAMAGSGHHDIMNKIDAVKAELKKARAVGNEWRDTGKLLKKAEKASKAGDHAKAEKLIAKARRQVQLALTQAASQANAGPR